MTILFAKAGLPHDVYVNAIRAGVTDTDFLKLNDSKNLRERVDMIPMKRLAEPAEIAATVYYLALKKVHTLRGTY